MSISQYMEELLDGAEIEWLTLGNERFFKIDNQSRRKPVEPSLRISGNTPYYGANNIKDYVDGFTHKGEYVLIAQDGSSDLEKYSIQYVKGKFWANKHVHVVRGISPVNTRFLYHYLCKINFIKFLKGLDIAKLTKEQMIQIPIPLPCPNNPEKSLKIQKKIVRILDTFTEIKNELENELKTRKKQYSYYRNKLFSFSKDVKIPFLEKLLDGVEVEWKELIEIADISATGVDKKKNDNENKVILLNYMDVFRNQYLNKDTPKMIVTASDKKITQCNILKGDIFITPSSEIKNEIGFSSMATEDMPGVAYSYHIMRIRLREYNITQSMFINHLFKSNILRKQINKKVKGLTRFGLTKTQWEKIKIPIPCPDNPEKSLKIQKKIVEVLDKFNTLTNSISKGLPREIELRQKQYEYFRNELLNFKKES